MTHHRKKLSSRVAVTLIAAASFLLAACASSPFSTQSPEALQSAGWLTDGVISIARPVPDSAVLKEDQTMLGFLPVEPKPAGKLVAVDREAGVIRFFIDGKEQFAVTADGFDGIESGSFEIVHKQRSAPWHATEEYFLRRKLPVPPDGSRERFLRGALGEYALFLRADLPIHSGPVPSEDVGGLRIDEPDMSRLYYSLEVGTKVEVR